MLPMHARMTFWTLALLHARSPAFCIALRRWASPQLRSVWGRHGYAVPLASRDTGYGWVERDVVGLCNADLAMTWSRPGRDGRLGEAGGSGSPGGTRVAVLRGGPALGPGTN